MLLSLNGDFANRNHPPKNHKRIVALQMRDLRKFPHLSTRLPAYLHLRREVPRVEGDRIHNRE